MIVGLCPVRISFAGGGTDMPEYYDHFGGNVITSTINQFTYAIIHPRHDESFQSFSPDFQKHYTSTIFEKIEIKDGNEIAAAVTKFLNYRTGINVILCSDIPAGSGLGASSSLMVNLVNVISKLKRERLSKSRIAETAFHIERHVLKWPNGKQDDYISSFGGFNFIKFQKNKVTVSPIKLQKNTFSELQKNLLLFFVGDTRNSSNILSDQIYRIKKRDKKTISSLHYVNELAITMHDALKNSDIQKFGELLHKGWLAKKKFAKGVSNSKIDKIYKNALALGASGGKLTGAGGGGHMLFYCEPQKQTKFITKMNNWGLRQVKFSFYNKYPQIVNLNEIVNN